MTADEKNELILVLKLGGTPNISNVNIVELMEVFTEANFVEVRRLSYKTEWIALTAISKYL